MHLGEADLGEQTHQYSCVVTGRGGACLELYMDPAWKASVLGNLASLEQPSCLHAQLHAQHHPQEQKFNGKIDVLLLKYDFFVAFY